MLFQILTNTGNPVPLLQALNALEFPERMQKLLIAPAREMSVELVLQKENGEIEVRQRDRWM